MSRADEDSRKTVVIHETFRISTQATGIVRIGDEPVAYMESVLKGRAVNGSLHAGHVNHGFIGATPKNEDGTLKACQGLVSAMNEHGATWEDPVLQGQDDDADAECRSWSERGRLRIQVVRARVDSAFWEAAHAANGGKLSGLKETLVDELRAPIEHKAGLLPPRQRSKLVLAISALETPGYTLGSIPMDFRERHGQWAASWGFQEIWLVGPSPSLTIRLA